MAAVATRNALVRMGFSEDAATYIVDVQGLDNLEEFGYMKDDDVTNLCRVVRKPGGTTGNNNDPNHGNPVSVIAENNLKLMCYYIWYRQMTSDNLAPADLTRPNVRTIKGMKEQVEKHKDPDPPELPNKNWPKNFEALDEYLRGCLGSTGIPLSYVTRPEVDAAADPAGGWSSLTDKLIHKAPIRALENDAVEWTAHFQADREKVWEKMSAICRKLDYCWTYIRPFQRTRDGRGAYLALRGHYLGKNFVDRMASQAEQKLSTTSYSGEKRNFNFEKYVQIHVEQHTILDGLKEHGYTGIDVRSKVRHFMNGIKTKDLDPVKVQILASEDLRADFDACVALFTEFLSQSKTNSLNPRVIAALKQGGGGEGEADMTVEDRYYNGNEYKKLSAAQKLGLKRKREARGHQPSRKKQKKGGKGGGGKGKGGGGGGKVTLSKSSINSLASAIAAVNATEDTEPETDVTDDEEVPMREAAPHSDSPNRENPALQRKKKLARKK